MKKLHLRMTINPDKKISITPLAYSGPKLSGESEFKSLIAHTAECFAQANKNSPSTDSLSIFIYTAQKNIFEKFQVMLQISLVSNCPDLIIDDLRLNELLYVFSHQDQLANQKAS